MKIDTDLLLCFRCGAVFENSSWEIFCCPYCRFSIGRQTYVKIYRYSFESIYYGHTYRKTYERAYINVGDVSLRYSLVEPSQFLIFTGVAILSGIIGNRSDALLMKVIKKIRDHFSSKRNISNADIELANNVQELKESISHFVSRFEMLPEPVRLAIIEEIVCNEIGRGNRTMSQEINMLNNKKKLKREFFAAQKRLQRRQKLNNLDVKDFWNNVD